MLFCVNLPLRSAEAAVRDRFSTGSELPFSAKQNGIDFRKCSTPVSLQNKQEVILD